MGIKCNNKIWSPGYPIPKDDGYPASAWGSYLPGDEPGWKCMENDTACLGEECPIWKPKKNIHKEIMKKKRQLLKKAKEKGLWENFGQDEVHKLEDEFPDRKYESIINDFDNWCMDVTDSDLK